ncbi:unnamed protein product, partial [Brenthis ino]
MVADKEITKKSGHTYRQWMFAITANFTILVYGLESGWISPITSLLQSEDSPVGYPLTDSQLSWIASVLGLTATFGVVTYSYVADKYGRKISVVVIAMLEAISWVIRLSYTSFPLLILARIFAGLAAGGCYTITTIYVKEISQEDLAGILGTLPILTHTTGIFLMYVMGAYMDYTVVIITALVVPILTIITMTKAPESPAFLVKQNKIEKAKETVAYLRGLDKDHDIVERVIDDLIKEEVRFKSLPTITFINILKNNSWRRGFILIMFLFTCYEVNGAFVIVTFATKMLTSTGIQFDVSPEVQSLSFPLVMIIASLGLTSCVERCGRKPLLIGTYGITALAMFALAIMIVFQERYGNVPAWMPAVALILSVAMCSGGVSPLTFIITTEMLNFHIRATVMGVVVTYAWFLTSIAQITYTPMANSMGEFAPYVFYGCGNLAAVFFVAFFLPETRGKTEEEIFKNVKNKNVGVI